MAKTKPAAVAENRIQSGIQRSFREIKAELKKVVWPSRQEAINLTMIVIIVMVAVGIFLGGTDFIFSKIIEMILGAF